MDPAPVICTVFPPERPLIATIPHSGEWLPPEAPWLQKLPREVVLLDIDRFVDQLYSPAFIQSRTTWIGTNVHRYAVDLNRRPDDIDASSVVNAPLPPGTHSKGFHWVRSTQDHPILTKPLSFGDHVILTRQYHDFFHQMFQNLLNPIQAAYRATYHLDCHSMPSQGTEAHADAGQRRPDVVVSDFEGKSSRPDFVEAIVAAFRAEGLQVSLNWPYKGGRITQRYGRPEAHHHTVQIELNRALYLDETTREKLTPGFVELQTVLRAVVQKISAFVDSVAEPVDPQTKPSP